MQQYINLAQCIYIAVMYSPGLINCDKYITLMQDVNKRDYMGIYDHNWLSISLPLWNL